MNDQKKTNQATFMDAPASEVKDDQYFHGTQRQKQVCWAETSFIELLLASAKGMSWVAARVLNGSGRPSLAPGRPRPDPEGQVKYGSGQRGPAVGQAGGRERWRFFRPPLTWADLGPALDPEIRKRVVNLQKITLKSFISWGRVKFCVEL